MDLSELERRTTVHPSGSVKVGASPITWETGEVKVAYRGPDGSLSLDGGDGREVLGYIHSPYQTGLMSSTRLPTEFFNHQLHRYDPESQGDVLRFVSEWGFPFLPSRRTRDYPKMSVGRAAEVAEAFEETSIVRALAVALGAKYFQELERCEAAWESLEHGDGRYPDGTPIDPTKISYPVYGDRVPAGEELSDYLRGAAHAYPSYILGDAISHREASLALGMLQESARAIMGGVRGGGIVEQGPIDFVNLCASHPHELYAWDACGRFVSESEENLGCYSRLTSAICNQLVDAFVDPAPWRDCACEGCSVTFKRKQSGASFPSSDSIYCSNACEERQRKRNQRAAARARAAE